MTFGSELKPNEFGAINGHIEKQIEVYGGLYKLLSEKAAAERDYGRKVLELARGFQEQLSSIHDAKEGSAANSLALTDVEAAAADPLELLPAVNEWAVRLEEEGRLHMQLASKVSTDIAEELHQAFTSLGDARKKSLEFYQKLLGERDKVFDAKDKARAHYEAASKALGTSQTRQERATSEKEQDRYRQKADKNSSARNQSKNEYILQVAVANAVKSAVNHQFTPRIMDGMQTINEKRVETTKRMLLQLLAMQEAADSKKVAGTQRATRVLRRVTPETDSERYIRKRIDGGLSKWDEQADFRVIVDFASGEEAAMAKDGESQVILRNMCLHADQERRRAEQEMHAKNEAAAKHRQQASAGTKGSEKAVEKAAEAEQDATLIELAIVQHKALRAAVEKELGPVDRGSPHEFKSYTVAISKTCDYCSDSIGGLNRKAARCALCGYTCHAKCQIKVSPSCPGPETESKGGFLSMFGSKKKSKHERTASAVSGGSSELGSMAPATPGRPSVSNDASANASQASLQRQASASYGATLPRRSTARALAEDSPTLPGSALLNAGRSSTVGYSGSSSAGTAAGAAAGAGAGLGIGALAAVMTGSSRAASEPAASQAGSGYVTVVYDYEGDGSTTLSVRAGDKVHVVEPDSNGSGWIRAVVNGREGLVPTAYVNMDEYVP
ncbi:Protein BZZ1, partial [Dipsacomyces acuminosporus]